jgi:hypothetical protein
VGETEKLQELYKTNFKRMQQIPCKMIAKHWIKAIEPKKQANHPYNGGAIKDSNLTRPVWWPPEGCPHKEPDHIKKERE